MDVWNSSQLRDSRGDLSYCISVMSELPRSHIIVLSYLHLALHELILKKINRKNFTSYIVRLRINIFWFLFKIMYCSSFIIMDICLKANSVASVLLHFFFMTSIVHYCGEFLKHSSEVMYLQGPNTVIPGKRKPKTNFVEVRTFWHLFRSFDRMWIFFIMAFQVNSKWGCELGFCLLTLCTLTLLLVFRLW